LEFSKVLNKFLKLTILVSAYELFRFSLTLLKPILKRILNIDIVNYTNTFLEKAYYIAIKNFSETIEELNLIYYYWDQLFRCIFEFSELISIVFNPKMITLLFNEKRYFYFKFISIDLQPLHNNILDLCRFATETLMVTKDLSFYFSSYYNFENEMNILFNILINEGRRFTSINYYKIDSPLIEHIIQV